MRRWKPAASVRPPIPPPIIVIVGLGDMFGDLVWGGIGLMIGVRVYIIFFWGWFFCQILLQIVCR